MQSRTLAATPAAAAASQHLYQSAQSGYENNNLGNNKQWSYGSESRSDSHSQPPQQQQQQTSQVNAEALKKLAEEERLFDIQFKKWEEEIEKWKRENVDHPDRQAYNEYEQKFEACRAQLLERRKQMNLRRAKLLGSTPTTSSAGTGSKATMPANYTAPSTQIPTTTTAGHNQGYPAKSNNQQQNYYDSPHEYTSQNTGQNRHNDNRSVYGQGNNKQIELQDTYDSYQETSNMDDYNTNDSSSFLPSSASSKGIPGLDLVPESDKSQAPQHDVIDITQDDNAQKGPDYNTISKGINNILGDAKIMNILNMVMGQSEPANAQVGRGQAIASQNMITNQNNRWNDNKNVQGYNNHQFGNQQMRGPNNMNPLMQNNQGQNYHMQQNQGPRNQGPGFPNQHNQRPGAPNQQNQRPTHPNMQNQRPGQPNQQNQGPNRLMQQGPPPGQGILPPGQGPQRNMLNNRQDGMEQQLQDQYYNENNAPYEQEYQNHGFNNRGIQPQRPDRTSRPLIPNLPGHQMNDFSKPPPNNMQFQQQNMGPPSNMQCQQDKMIPPNNMPPAPVAQPPKPKWVEEPLFTPSVIVEYEHKPLRLKGNYTTF